MTEEYPPPYTPTPLGATNLEDPVNTDTVLTPMPPGPEPGAASAGTVDVAKEEASHVAQSTVDATQHVAGVAKDQVAAVASEAGGQAKNLLTQARAELMTQAGQQQQRIAAGLRALGDELHSMSQHDGQAGVATDVAHQGAQRSRDAASWLEQREPGHLVEEVTAFARRKPGMFLLLAAGAGLAAGRLTRGVKDAAGEDGTLSAARDASSTAPAREGSRPFVSSQGGSTGFSASGGVG